MASKICLLTDSLSSGGAEKMVANLSVSLINRGYDVVIVSMIDAFDYPFKGTLYNFGKVKNENNKLQAFLKFRQFFKIQNFDFIIDHRIRNQFLKELIFSKMIFNNLKVIYCVHHFNLNLYFPVVRFPILAKSTLVKNRKIISVSKTIKQTIKQKLDLDSQVIYNYALKNKLVQEFDNEADYIIAVGRLVEIKQFDVLIKTYKNSKLPENNIKLYIFGEGAERENLERLIKSLDLDHFVKLKGFKNNLDGYLKNAKALVMSSKSEGFPMVLIEALALKTPVISFDCKSGPSEIIKHKENGLLVENQNAEKLTEALNDLMMNTELYNKIKKILENDYNPFSEEKIMDDWIQLLEEFN